MAEETETAAGDADAEEAQATETEAAEVEAEADEPQATEADAAEDRDVNRDGVIAALRRERVGYVQRGLKDRVSEVDAALKQLGAKAERESRTSGAPLETAVESKPRTTAGGRRPRGKS